MHKTTGTAQIPLVHLLAGVPPADARYSSLIITVHSAAAAVAAAAVAAAAVAAAAAAAGTS
jgi:hypothetical protein